MPGVGTLESGEQIVGRFKGNTTCDMQNGKAT